MSMCFRLSSCAEMNQLLRVGKPTLCICKRYFRCEYSVQTGGGVLLKQIEQTVTELLTPYLNDHGFELVEVSYVKEGSNWFLRVYVDREGGIDVDECGRISQFLSEQLDTNDPIPNAYFLEVSSPGAERPLKKPQDFYKAMNKYVLITTYSTIDGLKEFEGTLVAYDEQSLSVQVGKKTYRFNLDQVGGARLAIQF